MASCFLQREEPWQNNMENHSLVVENYTDHKQKKKKLPSVKSYLPVADRQTLHTPLQKWGKALIICSIYTVERVPALSLCYRLHFFLHAPSNSMKLTTHTVNSPSDSFLIPRRNTKMISSEAALKQHQQFLELYFLQVFQDLSAARIVRNFSIKLQQHPK